MKSLIKFILKILPINFTKNMEYDTQTIKVIRKHCTSNSNCIDIGCHKGEILDIFLKYASEGKHYAFEPIPQMYNILIDKYKNMNCVIKSIALSNHIGKSTFNYVKSNPAYSGLLKREYKNENEYIETITVTTDTLDNIIPPTESVSMIKIDVEGAELQVLEGAIETIKRTKPLIIFEHGLGASDYYGANPEKIYILLSNCGMHISTMKNWLSNKNRFTLEEFKYQYYNRINYYFIAFP